MTSTDANFVRVIRTKVQWIKVVTNHSIGTCSVDLNLLYLFETSGTASCSTTGIYIYIILHMCTHRVCLQSFWLFVVVERGDQCRERGELLGWRQLPPQGRNLNSRVPLRQGVWWMSLLYGFVRKPPYFGFGLPTCLSCYFSKGDIHCKPCLMGPLFLVNQSSPKSVMTR